MRTCRMQCVKLIEKWEQQVLRIKNLQCVIYIGEAADDFVCGFFYLWLFCRRCFR